MSRLIHEGGVFEIFLKNDLESRNLCEVIVETQRKVLLLRKIQDLASAVKQSLIVIIFSKFRYIEVLSVGSQQHPSQHIIYYV